jgi:hypothetical protein
MTLIITTSLSNFCPYSCSYCVAGSNNSRWDPPKSWNDVKHSDLLDVGAFYRWLRCFAFDSVLHISGGEPLVRPDVEDCLEKLCKYHRVRVYSNGQLISKRPRLLDLPIDWVVTWHQSQVGLDKFVRHVELLEGRRVVFRTVLTEKTDPCTVEEMKVALPWGIVHHGQWDRDPGKTWPSFKPDDADIDNVASQKIHLVVPRNGGEVWPCNSCAAACGPIGNISDGWYSPELAADMDRRAKSCVLDNKCAAFQDSVLLDRWFDGYSLRLTANTAIASQCLFVL